MATMHDDARQRGEAIAGLEASESIIYGRFGYGLAANLAEYAIDSRASAFAVPAPALDLALVDKDEATKVLPEIFDRQRRTRAGEVNRSPGLLEPAPGRPPAPPGRTARPASTRWATRATSSTGPARKPTSSRASGSGSPSRSCAAPPPRSKPHCGASCSISTWSARSTSMRRPVDEPIRWRLADPRQLRTVAIEDRLYVRILDTAAAFEARGYQGEGRLVLEVLPPASSEGEADPAPGRWVLEAGPDGASCRRAGGEDADLRLGLPALGSLYMGGFPASLLAAGGRIEELRAGSLAVADALLATRPAPRSGTGF